MASHLKWYGEQVEAQIRAELTRRLHRVCILVVNRAKQLLSVDGTTKIAGRDSKGRFKKQLRYHTNPSAPGEPPHVQTGRLRGSIAWEVVDLVGRVGTNVLYGRWLELGTRLMKARPWLRRALRELQTEILAILSKFIRGPHS